VRSYEQYCALARGLDVIGDRWTLLVVRELLVGPKRYSELLEGLPGVATNLLAERLRGLEENGVAIRDGEGRYRLTKWGEGLSEPVYALARWAGPLVAAPAGDDAFRSAWLALPVGVIFGGVDRRRPNVTIEIRTGEQPVTIESVNGEVRFRLEEARAPDLVLTGPPDGVVCLLAGIQDESSLADSGVSIRGDLQLLSKLRTPSVAGERRK
jgi:DNA-binding HxlR family transcriptional regulator